MTADAIVNLLPWVLPPFIGAVIGYVTNALAIRMLFRPLTQKRFLGLRVPLTPGIIPKQRFELAESIGRMVSRELITEDALKQQLTSKKFQNRLKVNIASLVEHLTEIDLATLRQKKFSFFYTFLEEFLDESLYRAFTSLSFIRSSRTFIFDLVHSLFQREIDDLAGAGTIEAFLKGNLVPKLTSRETRKTISRAVQKWLKQAGEEGRALSTFIPKELPAVLGGFLSTMLAPLFAALFCWLRTEDMRRELETRGKFLLRDIFDKLNLLQKFIISAGQFNRTLEEKMPAIVEEALNYLEQTSADEENRARIIQAVESGISKWRSLTLNEVTAKVEKKVDLGLLLENILLSIDEEKLKSGISAALEGVFANYRKRPIGEMLAQYLGLQEQDIGDFLANQFLSYISKRESSKNLAGEIITFVHRFLEEQEETTIGTLFNIDDEKREKITLFLTDELIKILNSQLPSLIRSFDIQELVVDKVNALEVIEVERLLLQVIASHLKWINLFGALLGALIGLSQIALRLLD